MLENASRIYNAAAVDLFDLSQSQQVRHTALQFAKVRKMSLTPYPLGHIRALGPIQPQGFELWHFFLRARSLPSPSPW